MKRIALAVLTVVSLAACAQATPIPTITLTPATGDVIGAPGAVVGWGFTLTYTATSDWVVLTGSEFTGSTVYGNYVDYLSLSFYVAGPAPESSTINQPWVSSSQLGTGEFDINRTALPGADIMGDIVVHYSVFSEDPNSPSFDPGSVVVPDATVTDAVQIDITPEPASLLMMSGAMLPLAFAGWRRKNRRRSPTGAGPISRHGT